MSSTMFKPTPKPRTSRIQDSTLESLEKLRIKLNSDMKQILESYADFIAVTFKITQNYDDFHQKLNLAMQEKLGWTENGQEIIVDRRTSVLALLRTLGEGVAELLKPYHLEKDDEELLIQLMRRHIAKVRELTDTKDVVVGEKSKVDKLPAKSTPTAKLARGALERRMFA